MNAYTNTLEVLERVNPWLLTATYLAILLRAMVYLWDKVTDGARDRQLDRITRAGQKAIPQDAASLRDYAEWLTRLGRPAPRRRERRSGVLPRWRTSSRSPTGGDLADRDGDPPNREPPAVTGLPSSIAS